MGFVIVVSTDLNIHAQGFGLFGIFFWQQTAFAFLQMSIMHCTFRYKKNVLVLTVEFLGFPDGLILYQFVLEEPSKPVHINLEMISGLLKTSVN